MEKNISKMVGLVVLLILIAVLTPVALTGIFNTTAFTLLPNGSGTYNVSTGVPAWVPSVLGILSVIAVIYIMLRVSGGSKK